MSQEQPQPGEVWEHYKGSCYEIIGTGAHTETGERLVFYKAVEGGPIWARPLTMFMGSLDENGYLPRFKLVR